MQVFYFVILSLKFVSGNVGTFDHTWTDEETGIEYNAVIPEAASYKNRTEAYEFCKSFDQNLMTIKESF